MRIDLHAINVDFPADLRAHAEKRLWQATSAWQPRVVWTGLWLVNDSQDHSQRPYLDCRVDAWVRGVGIVTVRHTGRDPGATIDVATALLEQAIARELRQVAQRQQQLADEMDVPAQAARP